MGTKKMTHTNFPNFLKNFLAEMFTIVDSFEIYSINSLIKIFFLNLKLVLLFPKPKNLGLRNQNKAKKYYYYYYCYYYYYYY